MENKKGIIIRIIAIITFGLLGFINANAQSKWRFVESSNKVDYEFFQEINKIRADSGLSPLIWVDSLYQVVCQQNLDQVIGRGEYFEVKDLKILAVLNVKKILAGTSGVVSVMTMENKKRYVIIKTFYKGVRLIQG